MTKGLINLLRVIFNMDYFKNSYCVAMWYAKLDKETCIVYICTGDICILQIKHAYYCVVIFLGSHVVTIKKITQYNNVTICFSKLN